MVKSHIERNPYPVLDFPDSSGMMSQETASETGRKVGMTSSQYCPYALGDTRATMASTIGSDGVTLSKSLKLVSVRIGA